MTQTRVPWYQNPPTPPPDSSNKPSRAVTCNGCHHWWGGLTAAHCPACHRTFTSAGAFDLHRRNQHCLHPDTVRTRNGDPKLVPAERPWSGEIWSKPGSWSGPDE